MKIEGFIWYSDILEKIETKHNVSTDEVESLFNRKPITRKIEKGHFQGENLYRSLGQSHNGRYLTVFFIYKATREALVISARDMSNRYPRGRCVQTCKLEEALELRDGAKALIKIGAR